MRIIFTLFTLMVFLPLHAQPKLIEIRGQVVVKNTYNAYGYSPLSYKRIELLTKDTLKVIAATHTDFYGFYYFKAREGNKYLVRVNMKKIYSISLDSSNRKDSRYMNIRRFIY